MIRIAVFTEERVLIGRPEQSFEVQISHAAAAGHYSMSIHRTEADLLHELSVIGADICVLHVKDFAKYRIISKSRDIVLGAPIIVIADDAYANCDRYLQTGASAVLPDSIAGTAVLAQIETLLYLKSDISLTYFDLVWDQERHEFRRAGVRLNLTKTESAILEVLFRRQERDVSREQLKAGVWANKDLDPGSIDRAISRLRTCIDIVGRENPIKTVHGFGYRLEYSVGAKRQRFDVAA
jgi:two-component system, OmpR family, response regulator